MPASVGKRSESKLSEAYSDRVESISSLKRNMATTAKKKPAATAAKQPRQQGLSDIQRWILGIILFVVGLLILLSVISYFFYWKADQAITTHGVLAGDVEQTVHNWCGKLGARVANFFVGRWFGLFGICVPIVIMIVALRIMRFRPTFLRKSVRLTLILMILGSLTLGLIFGDAWNIFGSGLGGEHGIAISRWLSSLIGSLGTGLVLLLAFIIYAVYINRNTIGFLNRLGKGVVDNGKKLGGALTSTAADLLTHETDKEGQPREQATASSKQKPGAGAASSEVNPSAAFDPNEIHPVPGSAYSLDPNAENNQVDHPAATVDECGFTVLHGQQDATGMNQPTADPEPPRMIEVQDDNGFWIRKPVDEAEAPAASQPVEQNANLYEHQDECGFTIQYAVGDDPQPTAPPAGAWPDRLHDDTLPTGEPLDHSSYGEATEMQPSTWQNTQPVQPSQAVQDESSFQTVWPGSEEHDSQQTDNPFKSDPVPPYAHAYGEGHTPAVPFASSQPAETVSDMQMAANADFVAAVPNDSDVTSMPGMAVNHLPEDRSLTLEEIENALYDPTLELSHYQRPPLELLEDHTVEASVSSEEIYENRNRIKATLENFGIKIDKVMATVGPTVTLYEIVPAPGVRISKIKNLEDDIALSLAALGIRIIAPIPGKGTIGIEVPNKDKKVVSMYSVIKSAKFQESTYDIPVALGKTIQNETFVIDLAKMPHLLVAGATGQGKSVGLNALITSLLYKKHPSELKLVLVDPKKVELTLYSKLDHHFLAKMEGEDEAIITDTHKVIYTLNSLCIEMDRRYELLRKAEVRHVKEYNAKFKSRRLNPNKGHRYLPYIVVIIDEFADLIMTAGREIETPIARIAQLARAVGIHLVIATQRPTTNIITGVIKANFPARIAFRVTSMVDSRTIIDQPGANQLIGRGDMLVSTGNELTRVQCAFVDTPEIERITEYISNQQGFGSVYELPAYSPDSVDSGNSTSGSRTASAQFDAKFEEVAHFVVQNQQGSTSSIQRRFALGYNRAGRIMDQLEEAGIVGRAEGSKPREVLIKDEITLDNILQSLRG